MDAINERIGKCIEALGIKKTHFANRLNVSQAFISQLTKGASSPSDRTISDICREFNVNETWLRTGEGEMFVTVEQDQAIFNFVEQVLQHPEDNFKRRFISALPKLTESDWATFEKLFSLIVGAP